MATPSSNAPGVSSFRPPRGDAGALQYGKKWGGGYGEGVALTYSFPDKGAWHPKAYGNGEYQSFSPLSGPEKAAVRHALSAWSAVADITFTHVKDNKKVVGDLRFGITDQAGGEAAHAYMPWQGPEGGDVWFQESAWHTAAQSKVGKGTYDYLTALHEIGHAIGLKHAFEGPHKISRAHDSFAYTVMSYSASRGGDNHASFYPTTPMYDDLVNIQGMYGRSRHKPGDTTYTFKNGKHYWQTIDDSGGDDTIVHLGRDKAVINLKIGHWSDLGKTIAFSAGSTKKTVMIGPGTKIENATGGKGADTIIGNGLSNVLSGGKGRDVLTGGGGDDQFLFAARLAKADRDVIRDFTPGEDVIAVARKLVKALDKGTVSASAFDHHFDYDHGVLKYHGKDIAYLKAQPTIGSHDLLVV